MFQMFTVDEVLNMQVMWMYVSIFFFLFQLPVLQVG